MLTVVNYRLSNFLTMELHSVFLYKDAALIRRPKETATVLNPAAN